MHDSPVPTPRLPRRAAAYGIAALCDAAGLPRPSVCDEGLTSDADDEAAQARACTEVLARLSNDDIPL